MTASLLDSKKSSVSCTFSRRPVPAWKRVGLKLKFVKEHTDQSPLFDCATSTSSKRRREINDLGSGQELHKRCRLLSPDIKSPKSQVTIFKRSSPAPETSTGNTKTVSFTSETKVEDGSSSRDLIAAWEAKYDHSPLSSDPQNGHNQSKNELSKRKKSKTKPAAVSPSTSRPQAALAYLTQFQNSRENWKFNKNREIWILKHLFLTDDLPPPYDLALSNYLQGLKSAVALPKLRAEAEAIIRDDQEQELDCDAVLHKESEFERVQELDADISNQKMQRARYEDSVQRYRTQLDRHSGIVANEDVPWVSPARLARRQRAEIVIWATASRHPGREAAPVENVSIARQVPGKSGGIQARDESAPINNYKKRKNRTCIVEVSSSMSSDSRMSSDDNSSEHESSASIGNSAADTSSDE